MQSPFSTRTNDRLSGLTKLKHINKTQWLDNLMQVNFRTLVYSLLKNMYLVFDCEQMFIVPTNNENYDISKHLMVKHLISILNIVQG